MAETDHRYRLTESTIGSSAGTYLKLVKMPTIDDYPNDCFMVLYLRPNSTFLFLGYWHGFERSEVAGNWHRENGVIYLNGHGDSSTDTGTSTGRRYQRAFTVEHCEGNVHLHASTDLSGANLLGYRGRYSYVGCETIIVDPHGTWMPRDLKEVDKRINSHL